MSQISTCSQLGKSATSIEFSQQNLTCCEFKICYFFCSVWIRFLNILFTLLLLCMMWIFSSLSILCAFNRTDKNVIYIIHTSICLSILIHTHTYIYTFRERARERQTSINIQIIILDNEDTPLYITSVCHRRLLSVCVSITSNRASTDALRGGGTFQLSPCGTFKFQRATAAPPSQERDVHGNTIQYNSVCTFFKYYILIYVYLLLIFSVPPLCVIFWGVSHTTP